MWCRDDIRHILVGIEIANGHLAGHFASEDVRTYRAGFQAALLAAAVSFGIGPADIEAELAELKQRPLPASVR